MTEQNSIEEISELDIEILKKLTIDATISFRELGRDLGKKSPVTIKKHIDEMKEKGIIKSYGVQVNYEKLGYNIIALIELTISKGKMLDEEQKIAKNPNVFAVYDITGEFDALILARFKSREDLSKMIKDIHKSPNVERTNTHLVLNVIKEHSSLNELMDRKE